MNDLILAEAEKKKAEADRHRKTADRLIAEADRLSNVFYLRDEIAEKADRLQAEADRLIAFADRLMAEAEKAEADRLIDKIRSGEKIRTWKHKTGLFFIDQEITEIEIELWQTGRSRSGDRDRLSYVLSENSVPVFYGLSDLGIPPHMAIDSDLSVCACLFFLALRQGDTDSDYFENYTDTQLQWIHSQTATEIREIVSICEENDLTLDQAISVMLAWETEK